MGLLQRIIGTKTEELKQLRTLPLPAPPTRRDVTLRRSPQGQLRLIAEIKFRSPSAGALSTVLSVEQRAQLYEARGADMISVLCDQSFFDGSFEHLARARRATKLPLLCKEFIIDECQLDAARAFGADAALLIVRCLTPARLTTLIEHARRVELVPFVEVTSEQEAELAVAAGAQLIGVNARDLDTLQIDLERARRVLEGLLSQITRVHLSGVADARGVATVRHSSADAALIGEVLMRQDDPGGLLEQLVQAAQS